MKVKKVTKRLWLRSMVLIAMLLCSTSVMAQNHYVITNGDANKRAKAEVGDKYLALDLTSGTAKIVVKPTFDESCVWTRTGSVGYYYQEDAAGNRYLLNRTGSTLNILTIPVDTYLESGTQWYDWTWGVACQELDGDARYYWVTLNEAGEQWILSCNTYGRPGVDNGDVSSAGNSNTAACAQYYDEAKTKPQVAATYTRLLVDRHEAVAQGTPTGGLQNATLAANSTIEMGQGFTAWVSGSADYASTVVPAYTVYQEREITSSATRYENFPEGIAEGTTAEEYYASGGGWYYYMRLHATHYWYNGSDHADAPSANSEARTIVKQEWLLEGSSASLLTLTPSESDASQAIVQATGTWQRGGSVVKLIYRVTYSDGLSQQLEKDITLAVAPTAVAATETTVDLTVGESYTGSFTLEPAGATASVTASGITGATVNNNDNTYTIDATSLAAGSHTLMLTAADGITTTVTVRVHPTAPTAITFGTSNDAMAHIDAITPAEDVYFTTDGTMPDATSTLWDAATSDINLTAGTVVKAVVIQGGQASAVYETRAELTTGLTADGKTVILNDLEDHNWSYYSDPDCPIRSLYPRNVQITYDGYGKLSTADDNSAYIDVPSDMRVQVGIDAPASKYVYLKTLERYDTVNATSRFAYRTITNPFSVRPTYGTISTAAGSTCWRGFSKWRIKNISGGSVYTSPTGGTALSAGEYIAADALIYFEPNNSDRTNANNEMSMTLDLEAVWDRAWIVTSLSSPTATQLGGSTEELNFVVYRGAGSIIYGDDNNIKHNRNKRSMTIMSIWPNGTTDGTTATTSIGTGKLSIYGNESGNEAHFILPTAALKIEYITLTGENSTASTQNIVYCNGNNLTIGRGVSTTYKPRVFALNALGSKMTARNRIIVESGIYGNIVFLGQNTYNSNNINLRWTIGSDYDRASNINNLLTSDLACLTYLYGESSATGAYLASANLRDSVVVDIVMKSGKMSASQETTEGTTLRHALYLGYAGAGASTTGYTGKRILTVEGGSLLSIAGGLRRTDAAGNPSNDKSVKIRIKGGDVRGIIYGAAEKIAAAGDDEIICTGAIINGFIAGGANASTTTDPGSLDASTHIYIGGNTQLPSTGATFNGATGGNVFGAGCGTGTSLTNGTGRVNNSTVVIADEADIAGSVYGGGNLGWAQSSAKVYVLGGTVRGKVFGGGNQNKGAHGAATVTMTGGTVLGGVYGGSNTKGTVGSAAVRVSGGTVGSAEAPASVYGNGYGSGSSVSGNVTVSFDRSTDERHATVWGSVFGGGQNAAYTSSGKTFKVDIRGGDIRQSVFGGGDNATVTGPTDVYVGGNATVWEHVFGGGNKAGVTGDTKVQLGSCTVLKNVYGGGNLGAVGGKTDVIIGE